MPRTGRRARFKSTAALSERIEGCDCTWLVGNSVFVPRKKGVVSSSWWIGESSEASLLLELELCRRKWMRVLGGYGEPQLAVTYWPLLSSDPAGEAGDSTLLRCSRARSESSGAWSNGNAGEEDISSSEPSTVELVEKAGDSGDSATRTGKGPMLSRAAVALGGVDGLEEDVFGRPE